MSKKNKSWESLVVESLRESKMRFRKTRLVNPQNKTRMKAVLRYGDRLYIGTLGKGLLVYDIKKNTFRRFTKNVHLRDDKIVRLRRVDETLFICTLSGGVSLFNLRSSLFGVSPYSILTEKKENVRDVVKLGSETWVATYGNGVYRFHEGKLKNHYTVRSGSLTSDYVLCLAAYRGRIYMGTLEGGISIFRPKSGRFEYWGYAQGLRSIAISVLEVENDYLWIGTLGGGIQIYREPSQEELEFYIPGGT